MREILAELGSLLLLAAFFCALAITGLVGVGFRRYYEYARHGRSEEGCLTLILSIVGLIAITLICFVVAPAGSGIIWLLGAVVIMVLGFFGLVLVPEGLGDD